MSTNTPMSLDKQLMKERAETDGLKRRALELGIEIPQNSDWWFDDFEGFGGDLQTWEIVKDEYTYLTEIGKAGVRKLIRNELRKEDEWRRARIEWKIRLIVTIITAITGLLGALIGIIAILKK